MQQRICRSSKTREGFEDVLAAEAKTIQLGIVTTEAARCRPMIFESDCQDVVDLVVGRKCSKTEIFQTISDIQEG